MPTPTRTLFLLLATTAFVACGARPIEDPENSEEHQRMHALLDQYATVRLEADVSHLSDDDQEVVRLLIQAVQPMDDVFWNEAYGDRRAAEELSRGDPAVLEYLRVNFGPWDRLRGDESFIEDVGAKPAGANFYPRDMTPEEFDAAVVGNPELRSLYTLVRRDESGGLVAVPYHEQFAEAHAAAAAKLREAAELASDPGLAHYLRLRADALETDVPSGHVTSTHSACAS